MRNPLLAPLSMLYKAGVALRHRLFDWGVLRSERFGVPVVCIGNITAGGTGKTPMCEMVLEHLGRTRRVALLSRGYGRRTQGYREVLADAHYRDVGDEPKMLKLKFPDAVVAVCEKRTEGIRRLLRDHPDTEVVVMDDGFQHRYVEAKVNIVMVDSTRPVWEDKMLPWGDLRDLPSQLYRANYFILTRCPEQMTPIDRRIHKKHLVAYPYQSLYFTRMEAGAPRPLFADVAAGELPCGTKVAAVAGIGNPAPFVQELRRNYLVSEELLFEDHHVYRVRDVQAICAALERAGEEGAVVTTEKDAVKLCNRARIPERLQRRLYYLPINISFIESSAADFLQKLDNDVRTD